MGVHINLNQQKILKNLKEATEYATFALSEQVLKDSNYYARQQTGELIRSSIRASNVKKGRLVWNTPYARRVYYAGTPRVNTNPNASLKWFAKAKSIRKPEWVKLAKTKFRAKRNGGV